MQTTPKHYTIALVSAATLAMAFFVIHKISAFAHWHFTGQPRFLFLFALLCIGAIFYFLVVKYYKKDTFVTNLLFFFRAILPPMIILLIGLNKSIHIHWLIHLLGGLYVIAYGMTFLYRYHKKQYHNHSCRAELSAPKKSTALMLLLIIATSAVFGFYHLKQQANVDEPLWAFERIEKLWRNIAEHDWYNVRPSDKPGVTTAAVAGVGLLFQSPQTYQKNVPRNLAHDVQNLYYAFRVPLLAFMLLTLPLLYFFLQRLMGSRIALVSLAVVATSPLLLGISRIINPDGLLWVFMTLTLLCYLCFIKKENIWYLYATGILLGLAILTKYVANLLILFIFLLLFLECIIGTDTVTLAKLKQRLTQYFALLWTTLVTLYLLFPAVWLEHSRLLKATFFSQAFETTWMYFFALVTLVVIDVFALNGKIILRPLLFLQKKRLLLTRIVALTFVGSIVIVICSVLGGDTFLNAQAIIASPKSAHQFASPFAIFLTGFYPLIFGSLPIIVFGVIVTCITLIIQPQKYVTTTLFTLTALILFVFMYYFGSAFNDVAPTVRYQITLYPLFVIIGAIGIMMSMRWIAKQCAQFTHTYISSLTQTFFAVLLIIITSALTLYKIAPHYFSYNNALLPQSYIINVKDMGDGSYEATQWLNAQPHAQELIIWTDKNGVCAYFVGVCKDGISNEDLLAGDIDFDYYVTSYGRAERTTKLVEPRLRYDTPFPYKFNLLYNLDDADSVFVIHPAHRDANYVRVINARTIDIKNTRN